VSSRLAGAVAAALFLGAAGARASDDPNGWQLLNEDDLVRVSSRPVRGTKVREILITATLPVPAARLIALIADVDEYPKFMPGTESARLLSRKGSTGRWYLVINPPVIERRDYCASITISKLPGGRMESRFALAEEGCPGPQPGRIRMTRLEGRWTLTPRGPGHTDVVYQAITDPAGDVPTWIVNRSQGDSIRDMFRALLKAAPDPKLAPCPGASLGCFTNP
jgi:hypothetical protein